MDAISDWRLPTAAELNAITKKNEFSFGISLDLHYLCSQKTIKRKKIMCKYNITLNDEVVSETRRSFASEAAMDAWLQQQVEALLVAFNARQAAKARARQAIEAMRRQSEQNGNAQLSLDEINNEIRLTREARKAAL